MDISPRKPFFGVCKQQRCRPAYASAQSDQHLCYSLIGKYHIETCIKQIFNFLSSFSSWGNWFESRFVRNSEDRVCRLEAQIISVFPHKLIVYLPSLSISVKLTDLFLQIGENIILFLPTLSSRLLRLAWNEGFCLSTVCLGFWQATSVRNFRSHYKNMNTNEMLILIAYA